MFRASEGAHEFAQISGLQKGPAERGHVKKRQKSSKSVEKVFDTFRQFSRRAKNVKNRQKVSKSFSTLFDNFRAAPFFRPLLQSAEQNSVCSFSDPNEIPGKPVCPAVTTFSKKKNWTAVTAWKVRSALQIEQKS